jgi:hypothetical protein
MPRRFQAPFIQEKKEKTPKDIVREQVRAAGVQQPAKEGRMPSFEVRSPNDGKEIGFTQDVLESDELWFRDQIQEALGEAGL